MIFRRKCTKFEISISTDTAAAAPGVWGVRDALKRASKSLISKDVWPPSSSDRNPMDYFSLVLLESCINRAAHKIKASLVTSKMHEAPKMEKKISKATSLRF